MVLQGRSFGLIPRIVLTASLAITAAFGVLSALPSHAAQSVPYKVNFQGRLTDNNGNIMPDGSYNIKFRLFDALSAGTNKYQEDRVFAAADNRVAVQNGLFNIQFGDVTAITPALFSGVYPLYLEVELPTPATATCATNGCAVFTEGAMTPRQPMASSPYAINSDTLDGLDSSAFAQLNISNTGNLTITGSLQSATAAFNGANALALGSTTNAGAIVFNDGTVNARGVTLNSPALTSSYSLSLPTIAPGLNQCLTSGASTASQLIFGSCGTGVTLQTVYSNSTDPEITLAGGTTTGLTIKDASVAVSGNLLEVKNNAATTTYFGVSSTGISVTGTATVSTQLTTPSVDAASGSLSIGTATATTVTVGRIGLTGNLNLIGPLSTTNNSGIVVGAADANQTNLVLDNSSAFVDAGTCSTTVNAGAIYYNSTSNSVRSCLNNTWEDLVSTAGLGLLAYGIVPDSGINPGDMPGLTTASVTGPCKVSASPTSTTQVVVQPCVAYSGGRKVVVPNVTTLTLSTMATVTLWQHVCFSSTTGTIGLLAPSAENAGFPAWSPSNPILCIADIKGTNNSAVLTSVYDTRTFTTALKEYTTSAAGLAIGQLATSSGNGVANTAATAGLSLSGVVVASSGAASTSNAPSAILAISGSTYVKATAGSANALIQSGATTAGYAVTVAAPVASVITCTTGIAAACTPSVATSFSSNPYAYLGYTRAAWNATACTAGVAASPVNCDKSLYTVIQLR